MKDLRVRDIISEENLATMPVEGVGMDEPAEAGPCPQLPGKSWQVVRGDVGLCLFCGDEHSIER